MSFSVTLAPGTLAPPTCYTGEQDRFNHYVPAIIVTVSGSGDWINSQSAPADLTNWWSRINSTGEVLEWLKWSSFDSSWFRALSEIANTGSVAGVVNAITITNTPAMTVSQAYQPNRMYVFQATITNTGPTTIEVDGLGPLPVYKLNSQVLDAGTFTRTRW